MLELDDNSRRELWRQVIDAVESFDKDLPSLAVSPSADPALSRALLADVDFSKPMTPRSAVELVVDGLRRHQVHTGHPSYFGLFNPAVAPMGVAADTLVAAFNPQLAAWTHAPFACEVEQLVLREFASRFGYGAESAAGSFTSGGAEANHSALLMALTSKFPEFATRGLRGVDGDPVFYVSSESHHSFIKASRLTGLGDAAIRVVPTDDEYRLCPKGLESQIRSDRAAGARPFLVVATMGTTGAGILDPIDAIGAVAEREGLWMHADAAWGGAAALLPEMAPHFLGLEQADSITFDAHKWMSVPMSAGLFLTRHRELQEPTFAVDTGYMPIASGDEPVVEPHRTSMQWTRRFIGLKLFLTLLVAGFQGYEETIREMVRLGGTLRQALEREGFRVVNRTPLPVVCFQDDRVPAGHQHEYLKSVAERIAASGQAWLSTTRIGSSTYALRACISNFRNSEREIEALVGALAAARPSA